MSAQDIPARSKVEPSGGTLLSGRDYTLSWKEDGCATLRAFQEARRIAREEAQRPRVALVKTAKRSAK